MIPLEDLPNHLRELTEQLQAASFDEDLKGPIRSEVLKGHRANFNSSASPDGANWPPRKVRGDGHPLLMDTGALMQAATGGGAGHVTEVSDGELFTGVDTRVKQGGIPAAGIHNYGRGKMPKREFLGVTEERLKSSVDELVADAGLKVLEP